MEFNNYNLKNKLKASHYRSLSYINKEKFPVKTEKKLDQIKLNQFLKVLVKSGMNLGEIENKLQLASKGEQNEFSNLIVKNQLDDEQSMINNGALVLLGAITTAGLINIFV